MRDATNHFSRRIFLYGMTATVAICYVNAPMPSSQMLRKNAKAWSEFARRVFVHHDSAEAIGKRFLVSNPRREVKILIGRVTARIAALKARSADLGARELVVASIRTDYTRSRTTLVEGWLLSETEVALSVLAAMSDFGKS